MVDPFGVSGLVVGAFALVGQAWSEFRGWRQRRRERRDAENAKKLEDKLQYARDSIAVENARALRRFRRDWKWCRNEEEESYLKGCRELFENNVLKVVLKALVSDEVPNFLQLKRYTKSYRTDVINSLQRAAEQLREVPRSITSGGSRITVHVVTLGESGYDVSIRPSSTIDDLMHRIQGLTRVPVKRQKLFWRSSWVSGSRSLDNVGISDGDTVLMLETDH